MRQTEILGYTSDHSAAVRRRILEVLNGAYDPFIDLGEAEGHLDCSGVYSKAKAGMAGLSAEDHSDDLKRLFDPILRRHSGSRRRSGCRSSVSHNLL